MARFDAWCRQQPQTPWLFHRPAWDWQWRSLERVSDQAVRGVHAIQDRRHDGPYHDGPRHLGTGPLGAGLPGTGPPRTLGCWLGAHPDAVAGFLAILASGHDADLGPASTPAEALILPRASGDGPTLPECRGELEREPLVREPLVRQPLVREPLVSPHPVLTASGGVLWRGRRLTQDELIERATGLGNLLGNFLPSAPSSALSRRPILLTSPDLSPLAMAIIIAWSIDSRPAWAFEPHAPAFTASALWTRPTVIIARRDDVVALADAFDRSARRHSRLAAVVIETDDVHATAPDVDLGTALEPWRADA